MVYALQDLVQEETASRHRSDKPAVVASRVLLRTRRRAELSGCLSLLKFLGDFICTLIGFQGGGGEVKVHMLRPMNDNVLQMAASWAPGVCF